MPATIAEVEACREDLARVYRAQGRMSEAKALRRSSLGAANSLREADSGEQRYVRSDCMATVGAGSSQNAASSSAFHNLCRQAAVSRGSPGWSWKRWDSNLR